MVPGICPWLKKLQFRPVAKTGWAKETPLCSNNVLREGESDRKITVWLSGLQDAKWLIAMKSGMLQHADGSEFFNFISLTYFLGS